MDLGLLDYRATGALYRETDIGLTLQISRHPSYLPLELMACGVPMVAPDSSWFSWLFQDGDNSLLAMRTYEDIVERLDTLVRDAALRKRLSQVRCRRSTSPTPTGTRRWRACTPTCTPRRPPNA